MSIVDIDTAKEHLRVLDNFSDADILLKLEQASAIVVDYLKKPVGTWEIGAQTSQTSSGGAEDAPWPVQCAVLLVLGELYKEREAGASPLSQGVKDLLHRYRDPALA